MMAPGGRRHRSARMWIDARAFPSAISRQQCAFCRTSFKKHQRVRHNGSGYRGLACPRFSQPAFHLIIVSRSMRGSPNKPCASRQSLGQASGSPAPATTGARPNNSPKRMATAVGSSRWQQTVSMPAAWRRAATVPSENRAAPITDLPRSGCPRPTVPRGPKNRGRLGPNRFWRRIGQANANAKISCGYAGPACGYPDR